MIRNMAARLTPTLNRGLKRVPCNRKTGARMSWRMPSGTMGARSLASEWAGCAGEMSKLVSTYSLNVSSWFYLPDQGMTKKELLSRGSAFVVPWRGVTGGAPGGDEDQRMYHIVTSAHVVHPFAFPAYYAEQMEWLKFVSEEHVSCHLEARDLSGRVIAQLELRPKVHRHEARDVAVLHAPVDELMMQMMTDCGRKALSLAEVAPSEGDVLSFVGHYLKVYKEGEDVEEQGQAPKGVVGLFAGRGGQMAFCKTEEILQMGMCGGPVIANGGQCIGMIEGIVSNTGPEELRGLAVVIERDVIDELLGRIADAEEGEEGEEGSITF